MPSDREVAERMKAAKELISKWSWSDQRELTLAGFIAEAFAEREATARREAAAEATEADWRDALAEIARRLIARLEGPPFDTSGAPMASTTHLSYEIGLMRVALGWPVELDAEMFRRDYAEIFNSIRALSPSPTSARPEQTTFRCTGACRQSGACDCIPANHVPSPTSDRESAAARDVLAERRRQVAAEGWTPEHDDSHLRGEMALAAACYAITDFPSETASHACEALWPWSAQWWKPKSLRRNLVRAGALILAEIERLDRARERSDDRKGGEHDG